MPVGKDVPLHETSHRIEEPPTLFAYRAATEGVLAHLLLNPLRNTAGAGPMSAQNAILAVVMVHVPAHDLQH
jgi:hypothetical protein